MSFNCVHPLHRNCIRQPQHGHRAMEWMKYLANSLGAPASNCVQFIRDAIYLHVCTSTTRLHVAHFTSQHQWNRQLHRSI